MKFWSTKIKAICPIDGELKTFEGPHVPGLTKIAAQDFCNNNLLGFCEVTDLQVTRDIYTDDSPNAYWCCNIDYDNIIKN